MSASVHATYAALSWSAVAFFGALGVCWLVRPRRALPPTYWSFVFKIASTGALVVGLLALILGAGFIWEV